MYHYATPVEICDAVKLYLPFAVDTEFQSGRYPFIEYRDSIKTTITVQYKHPHQEPVTLEDPSLLKYNASSQGNNMFMSNCIVIDLLKRCGYDVIELEYDKHLHYNRLYVEIGGFFLIADVFKIFKGEWLLEILQLVLSIKNKRLEHNRILQAYTRGPGGIKYNHVCLEKVLSIDGYIVQIAIIICDISAIQGKTTYHTLGNNLSMSNTAKELITNEQKRYMLEVYKKAPEILTKYTHGDLMTYEMIEKHRELFYNLYKMLGLERFYELPKPTIGASVKTLFENALLCHLGFENKQVLYEHIEHATHNHLVKNLNSTSAYLAKTNGGRCYNNRNLEPAIEGTIVDVDISSCYGQGLELQDFPIGKPIVIQYPIDSSHNDYYTMKTFMNKYGSELIDGLWYCRFSTTKPLSFDQDYFYSWFPPKDLRNVLLTDYILNDNNDEIFEGGQSKILQNEVHLGVLQSDSLEWIQTCLKPEERCELMENTVIIAACFYPKCMECKTIKEYLNRCAKHDKMNSTDAILKDKRSYVEIHLEECHAWYRVNLGGLIITKLLKLRSKYSKTDPKEATMNKFIKLVINTVYGDIVSPYFAIGNTTVGNNITARARSMAWYMEKALHGIQTITDGCTFDINHVIKSRYKLNRSKYEEVVEKDTTKKTDISLGPLLGRKLVYEEAISMDKLFLADLVMKHIIKSFKKPKVIYQFKFEIKNIAFGIATHGASNYQLRTKDNIIETKMRSYKNNDYRYVEADKKVTAINPSRELLNCIYKEPNNIPRSKPFVEEEIVKTKCYRNNYNRMLERKLVPGDTDYNVRLLRECSLSIFKFRTLQQYKSWTQQYSHLKRKYDQSYEMFYMREHRLRYKDMVRAIQRQIKKGNDRYKHNEESRTKIKYKHHPYRDEKDKINDYITERLVQI